MRHRNGIFVLFGILGAVACGGASQNDFSSPIGASGQATAGGSSGTGGSGAQGGSTSTGGSAQGGKGGSTNTGGSTTTGGSGGSVSTGGASGTSGTGGDATGGTSGTSGAGTGGTGEATGGSAGTGTQTGGAGGAGGSKGGMGGSGGMPTVDCDALAMDYSMTLEQAQACNPSSGKADQCTDMVKGSLTCGCNVFVNSDNTDALAHLDELRMEAGTHCVTPCPAIACVLPGSTCMAVTGGAKDAGRCATQPLTPAQ